MQPFYPYRHHKSPIASRASKYGVSKDAILKLCSDQDYRCAICNAPSGSRVHRIARVDQLVIDHDHQTGKVRGLLCRGCNYGLGLFKDSPEILNRAILYLENACD